VIFLSNEDIQPRQISARDVVTWAVLNGVIALPGQPKTKKPLPFIAKGRVETPEGADPEKDTYHVPTPQRILKIENFWENLPNDFRETELSIALNTEYPCLTLEDGGVEAVLSSNVNIAALDLDTDDYYERFINHPLLAGWPIVRGERGCKAFVKVNYNEMAEKPENLVFKNPVTDTAALEILTFKKLAFVYGEHPHSKPEKRISYQFIRGFNLDTPTIAEINYEEFKHVYETIALDLDIVLKQDIVIKRVSPLEHLRSSQQKIKPRDHTRETLTDLLNLRIDEIGYPDGQIIRSGDEIVGSHPIHGSGSGQNYHINPSKNVWRCYSSTCGGGPDHGTGGDPLMFLAMKYGLIQCSDCHAGVLNDPRLMRELISRMRAEGYVIPERERGPVVPLTVPTSITDITVAPGDRSDLPSVEEFSEGPTYIHLSASPRKGKTHRIIEYLLYGTPSGTYLTHTHSTCSQAFRIASDMAEELRKIDVTRSVLWLAGKGKCCIEDTYDTSKTPCKDCPLYPGDERISMNRYEREAKQIIDEKLILSPIILKQMMKDRAEDKKLCPYYILKNAEPYADVVITVPHFLTVKDKTARIRPRDTIVIDEDTTIGSFYPGSIEIASFVKTKSQNHFDNGMDVIKEQIDSLKKIATTNDAGDEKKRLTSEDKVIIKVSGIVDRINGILESLVGDLTGINPLEALNGISFKISLDGGDTTISNELKLSTIDKVEKYEREISGGIDEDTSISELFAMLLFHCESVPLWWQGRGSTKCKLYLIGNEEFLIRKIGIDAETKQIIVIGFTRAETFIKDMQKYKPGPSIKYDIKKFDYGKNFVLVKVGSSPNDVIKLKDGSTRIDAKSSAKKRFRKLLNHAASLNTGDDNPIVVPAIVLTSSSTKQDIMVKGHSSDFIPLKKEVLRKINRYRVTGSFLVVVSNSTFTRGIDVDMYDIMWSASTDYAHPYCDAVFETASSIRDIPTMDRISALRYSYIVDEITNCILRISPVRGGEEEQSKIIIMPDFDAERIHPKVLEDMYVVNFNDVEGKDKNSKIDSLWNVISLCAKKYNLDEDTFEPVSGLNWRDAREEFEHFVASGPEEGKLIASARRERQSKIDNAIITGLKSALPRRSKDSLLKFIKGKVKIKKLRNSEIESRISYLAIIGRISSMVDPRSSVIYYRYILTDYDINDTSSTSYSNIQAM